MPTPNENRAEGKDNVVYCHTRHAGAHLLWFYGNNVGNEKVVNYGGHCLVY